MFNKLIVIIFLAGLSHFGWAGDCPEAIDVADQLGTIDNKNCDYTKTGLNGALHRALKGNSAESDSPQNQREKSNLKPEEHIKNTSDIVSTSEFSTAQQLQVVRFTLIQKAALACDKGFEVNGERYLPTATKSLKLELIYHCL